MRNALLVLAVLLVLPQTVAQANQPPVADAGPDVTVFVGQSVALQGSATDPDGDPIVSWAWTIESAPLGSSPLLVPDTAPIPAFSGDLPGDYVLSLVVSDGIDFSLPDTVTVTTVVNLPPVAVASADVVSGVAPLTVTFDGTGSFDPEGGALDFDWRFGDASPGATTPVASHTYLAPSSFIAVLEVVDDRGQIGVDFLVITVTAPPDAVPLDIKPQTCPNLLKVKKRNRGMVSVVILGTADLDVTTIDPASIRLEGVAPVRSSYEDVGTPFEPFTGKTEASDCTADGPDGFLDLILKFRTQEIVDALGDVADGDVLRLILTGESTDGDIVGEDVLLIKKKQK